MASFPISFADTARRQHLANSEENADNRNRSSAHLRPQNISLRSAREFGLKDFPNLPLVESTRIEFGKSKLVDISEEAYVPSRPISIGSFLSRSPPRKASARKTLRQRVCRKARQLLCLITNPKADLRYPYLPRGANNRINPNKDPLKDKLNRLRNPKKSKSKEISKRPTDKVPAPKLSAAEDLDPVPSREAPRIEASKNLKSEAYVDRFLNPFGGDIELFYQTPQERTERIELVNSENKWRTKSNRVLELRGRTHLSDPLIGRAPPLSRRQLGESANRLPSPVRINTEALIPGLPREEEIHCKRRRKTSPSRKPEKEEIIKLENFDHPRAARKKSHESLQLLHNFLEATEIHQSLITPNECSSPTFNSRFSDLSSDSSAIALEDTVAALVKGIVVSESSEIFPKDPVSFTLPIRTTRKTASSPQLESTSTLPVETSSIIAAPFNPIECFDFPIFGGQPDDFDIAGNNNFFVGFARLPESSFLPFPSLLFSNPSANSSSFSEQLVNARQALRPTQLSASVSSSPESRQQTPTPQTTVACSTPREDLNKAASTSRAQVYTPSQTSVSSLAEQFEESCKTFDRQSNNPSHLSDNLSETKLKAAILLEPQTESTSASPESYFQFSGNPWIGAPALGPPEIKSIAQAQSTDSTTVSAPKSQSSLEYSSASDPDHPWVYSGDPFDNPPEARKDCWDLSARGLLGEQRSSEEHSRLSSEAIRELAQVVDPDGEVRNSEKQRRRRATTQSKSRRSTLLQDLRISGSEVHLTHRTPERQPYLNSGEDSLEAASSHYDVQILEGIQGQTGFYQSPQSYLNVGSEPSTVTSVGLSSPISEVPQRDNTHDRQIGHRRRQFSQRRTEVSRQQANSLSADSTSGLDLGIEARTGSPRYQYHQSSEGEPSQTSQRKALFRGSDTPIHSKPKYDNSNSNLAADIDEDYLQLYQRPSFGHDYKSTSFSGVIYPLVIGSPSRPFALAGGTPSREPTFADHSEPPSPFSLDQLSPSSHLNESTSKKRTRDKLKYFLSGSRTKSVDRDIEQELDPQKTITGRLRRNKFSKELDSSSHTPSSSDHHPAKFRRAGDYTDLDVASVESTQFQPSTYLASDPVIEPKVLRETSELGRKENNPDQDQILSQLGSKFHNSPEITYPPTVDGWGIPSRLLVKNHRPNNISLPRVDCISLHSPLLVSAFDLPPSPGLSSNHTIGLSRISGSSTSTAPTTPLTLDSGYPGSYFPANLSSPRFEVKMDQLQVRPADFSSVKTKAIEDARNMQASVMNTANKLGQTPPKYILLELIGKGSFGRVYKAKDLASAAMVAVKIINIDESDHAELGHVDTFADFMKEVNALKRLKEQKAKNINNVIDAFPIGHSMWMITEHCGGGSVATLMRPTAPGGLQERWIIPVLREVAEAVSWVHQAGIIHRDLKCANVLITEDGGVQLCDFGVAGIIETKLDKRSTMIGTPHWMAPELFGPTPKYGKEVDIWALGCMVFEMATGLPPNVANNISIANLATHLQHHTPRLVGDQYSDDLKDVVAFCLEELPSARPSIEEITNHPYILNTEDTHPTSSLVKLVQAFKMWEDHGGSRRSLFMMGGAQGPKPSEYMPYEDEWNFSTTAAFDQEVSRDSNPQDVYEAYGAGVVDFAEETSRPTPQKASRRRPPPEALNALPIPLQKLFDSNTLTSYKDISREQYGRNMPPPDDRNQASSQSSRPRPTSDLPLRDDTAQTSIRDTMIDLGGHDAETGISFFPGETIKADRRPSQAEEDDGYGPLQDFSKPALSDPADMNPNRRTQDWKFPAMAPPASADPEISRFPNTYEPSRPAMTPGSGNRPTLVHHSTEPVGNFNSFSNDRKSLIDLDAAASDRMSLIDLDAASHVPELTRPSTANSDVGSAASEYGPLGNPFELERHASMYISDFSASDAESTSRNIGNDYGSDSDYLSMAPPPSSRRERAPTSAPSNSTMMGLNAIPPLQAPPSMAAMSGTAGAEEMEREFEKQFGALTVQLGSFRENFIAFGVGKKSGKRGGGS